MVDLRVGGLKSVTHMSKSDPQDVRIVAQSGNESRNFPS